MTNTKKFKNPWLGAPGTFFGLFQWCQGMFLKVPEGFKRKKFSSCTETLLLPTIELQYLLHYLQSTWNVQLPPNILLYLQVLGVRKYESSNWSYHWKMLFPLALAKFLSSVLAHVSVWKVPVHYAHTVKVTNLSRECSKCSLTACRRRCRCSRCC